MSCAEYNIVLDKRAGLFLLQGLIAPLASVPGLEALPHTASSASARDGGSANVLPAQASGTEVSQPYLGQARSVNDLVLRRQRTLY